MIGRGMPTSHKRSPRPIVQFSAIAFCRGVNALPGGWFRTRLGRSCEKLEVGTGLNSGNLDRNQADLRETGVIHASTNSVERF
jgi:hypothetical protein